jgi:NAD(P)-dependent dehydrogenase (short-subunit alcohol dehydrogenase family)
MSKTWFITGTSRGFGRQWAEAALERGDRVAATARDVVALGPMAERFGERILPIALDVTDRDAVFAAVAQAYGWLGSLDVVVNNAGYGHFGMVEEVTEQEARAQMEVNFFGALWVTQAVLPIMRSHKAGHIVQVSSVAGVFCLPGQSVYHASKFALEGLSGSLAMEVKQFGIDVTLLEPAGYATDWMGASAVRSTAAPAYDEFRTNMIRPSAERGDPAATRDAILAIADAEQPPLRVFLGGAALPLMRREYAGRIAEWERWNDLSESAAGL